jgi:hypothetical protein
MWPHCSFMGSPGGSWHIGHCPPAHAALQASVIMLQASQEATWAPRLPFVSPCAVIIASTRISGCRSHTRLGCLIGCDLCAKLSPSKEHVAACIARIMCQLSVCLALECDIEARQGAGVRAGCHAATGVQKECKPAQNQQSEDTRAGADD